ncbi:anoctamin-7-like [Hypanus sabinus]|uniref:anoctamin-7-like n=1 Tax=Hypanus sabinus TaxID=79690 RepID=UPI0028C4679E|nr:anoctamin-7-like [Hypanus sabinus]
MDGTEKLRVIDYVLIYEDNDDHLFARERMEFLREVKKTGLCLVPDVTERTGGNTEVEDDANRRKERRHSKQIIKIFAPFNVLSQAAEKMRLKMPLDIEVTKISAMNRDTRRSTVILKTMLKYLETDDEADYFSAPYKHDKRNLFKGAADETTFFRPAVRSLIVNYILNGIQMPRECHKVKEELNEDVEMQCFVQPRNVRKDLVTDGKTKLICSLPYLLMKKAFTSAFTLHEGPEPNFKMNISASSTQGSAGHHNSWTDLNILWANAYRFQPLWKIRNYFGEKIAFYFAVMEVLLLLLIVPALVGLAIFGYGLYYSVSCNKAISNINTFLHGFSCNLVCSTPSMVPEVAERAVNLIRSVCDNIAQRKRNIEQIINGTCAFENHYNCTFQVLPDDIFTVFNSSFDNHASPAFGFFICFWGTIFLEFWKMKNAELVYEWDVEDYESDELVRPEFYGTEPDPITGEPEAFYSPCRQHLKYVLSFSVGILMVGWVFISVLAVVIYKTWARFRVTESNSFEYFLLTTVVSSLLNALSISVMGKIYQLIAVKMTKWENHRTQTEYNDALILKLFAFQFANSYSPLFYIAFLRPNNEQMFTSINLPGLEDNCGQLNNCMVELSFQVLTLIITETLPKFVNDNIVPLLKGMMNRWCGKSKILSVKDCNNIDEYILLEDRKPDLGDFTLEEYTVKVIQYGYMMLFAACFPLGPLVFLLTIWLDMHLDAKRLLRIYKRPIAHMAQDIGHWFTILDVINCVAVVTNGCLIVFTSESGREKPFYEKLRCLIIFEHALFIVKFLLSTFLPGISKRIKEAIRREKYEAQKIMEAKTQ